MQEEEDIRLRRLAGGPREAGGVLCPALADWASLAAGLLDAGRRDELLAHATECDSCGAALHAVMEDFSADLTAEESQALDSVESASPEWQRKVARRMAEDSCAMPSRLPLADARGSVPSRDRKGAFARTWLAKAAAVLLAVGAGYLAWNQLAPRDPAHLIASAYTEQRPFEYRVPGAAYAPIRQERGTTSSFDRPQALNDAISKIGAELKQHPEDVKWMDLRARAEMMGRDPDAAIATLQHGLEQKPDDAGLLADLGAAYALRADGQSRAVDYGYAIDYLNRAIQKKPDFPEAVFNLALVYGKMNSDDLAMGEWQQYLKLDPAGAWRQDAQRHLTELELKKKSGSRP